MPTLNASLMPRKFGRMRLFYKVQQWVTVGVVVLTPILLIATFLLLGPMGGVTNSVWVRSILLADLVFILLVAALIMQKMARIIAARRRHSAGSKLHMRLSTAFGGLALLPTIVIAVFSVISVNFGLEGWFSDKVKSVVDRSLAAAEAYEADEITDLTVDIKAVAQFLNNSRQFRGQNQDAELRILLTEAQPRLQRGVREAFVIDGAGEIKARGEYSYLFDFDLPTKAELDRAQAGDVVVIEDLEQNEFRALYTLDSYPDRLIYISRAVDGRILGLLADSKKSVGLYKELDLERGALLLRFGLIYIGVALIIILAAIWFGMWFAERLARPIGELTGAARLVGGGDLNVRVPEGKGDDEIAMLGRFFNQMTKQLKAQRDNLIENTEQIERRRRLFDSVLSSVTSGVVGLSADGQITFVNKSAERLLDMKEDATDIALVVPEFGLLWDKIKESGGAAHQEIKLTRSGVAEHLLVRISERLQEDGTLEGYVIAFDDVTNLVMAQRTAAWGDVARRIAHEIKNPLTPIQLSAERIMRKFGPKLSEPDHQDLTKMARVIVRQTGDLRHIVDEFSQFARMPEPDRQTCDLRALVQDAVTLQDMGQAGVEISARLHPNPLWVELDATMMSQALTNLIKNGGEAIETRREKRQDDQFSPQIRVSLTVSDQDVEITIEDNGIGLPEDRAKLFEPYVTTRDKGTGLGLPIVKKIIEEHGGSLALVDAASFDGDTHQGAKAIIRFTGLVQQANTQDKGFIHE
ncbi:MAG: ATP-binding protein [Halocynthiibacter sp.]